jgi:AdoMet-dependent rRNA methyltransferase SPB1
VSAEIFVVCRRFLAPKRIDPKFLDPKHVFKDLSAPALSGTDPSLSVHNAQANVFHPGKKRRQRDGYEEGNYTLFKKAPVGDFVRTNDPIAMLGSVSQFTFESEEEQRCLSETFP